MKRIVPILVVVIAIAAFWLRESWLPQSANSNVYLGSIEAKMILVGPLSPGRLEEVKVAKGARIAKGEVLFKLESSAAAAQVAQAEASAKTAEANLADLEAGKRPEELAVFDRQEDEARANLNLAQTNYRRAVQLNNQGVAAQSQFDSSKAAVDAATAQLAQIAANRKVAELPARSDAVAAAQSRVEEARAGLANAQSQLSDRAVVAPVDARIDDIYFDAGEVVQAGQPIIALLADNAPLLHFYLPEADLAKLKPGIVVNFSCDHCPPDQKASVSRIYSQPEFTPPVIYSENARGKLVFQVEARPEAGAARLQPGQPVSVEPPQ